MRDKRLFNPIEYDKIGATLNLSMFSYDFW